MDKKYSNIFLSQANELFKLKEYAQAIDYYENSIKVDPSKKDEWLK